MAITRLTDLITVFESKWTYGDVKFGYETEVNQDHDAKYPLMLIQPPSSIIPLIYDGREEYEFEINFYNLYSQSAQSVVTLQKRWDNLQDLAMEWLDFVLKNYQDSTVQAYLNEESVEIERVKEVANDRLVQIKMTFTMSAFTKCFRPVSKYPSDYSDLVIWLKADSGVTFDIPTQRVSAWADQSGNSNNVLQATTANQPLRYGYDGADDKSYLFFDGINDKLETAGNSPISATGFTAFMVAKQPSTSTDILPVFSYRKSATANFYMGFRNNQFYAYVDAGDGGGDAFHGGGDSSTYKLLSVKFRNTGELRTQLNGGAFSSSTIAGWDSGTVFNEDKFNVGYWKTNYGKVDIGEIVVYNRELTDAEIADVNGYLNTKYKIY